MRRRSRRASADAAAREADEALLILRLRALGLHGVRAIRVHENRTVLVTLTDHRALRIHRGYAYAPDRVLEAVVAFVVPGLSARERKRAERTLVGFPVDDFVFPPPPRRSEPRSPQDRRLLRELRALHAELNRRHFAGVLAPVRFRVSRRMRTRLGELTVDPRTQRPTELAISSRHIEEDGWEEVTHTLLHEMIHQWQVESGVEADHGPLFRRKALEVGVAPRARRLVKPARRAARTNGRRRTG